MAVGAGAPVQVDVVRCHAAGCGARLETLRPYCAEHVELMPYVQEIRAKERLYQSLVDVVDAVREVAEGTNAEARYFVFVRDGACGLAPVPALPPAQQRRMLAARRASVRAGRAPAGGVPYGYRRGPGNVFVQDPDEAAVVWAAFNSYLYLRSFRRVIEFLQRRGFRPRRARAWSRANLAWMFHNDTYVGYVRMGSVHARGAHEPLIDEATFNQVKKLMSEKRKRPAAAGVGAA